MANETLLTIIGNLTRDPELRFTNSGQAVCNFTIASTPRTYNKDTGEWVDGDPIFLDCSVWQKHAENVAETLQKGMRVITQGRLKQRSFEHEGQKRTAWQLEVDEVGPCLRYATATVNRGEARPAPRADDPWAAPKPQQRPQNSRAEAPKLTGYVQDDIDSTPPF